MAERPILFSAPMVRAILAGTKTQTRRAVKPQPSPNHPHDGGTVWMQKDGLHVPVGSVGHLTVREKQGLSSPFGQPGDRLWVRETHAPQADGWGSWERWTRGDGGPAPIIHYAADAEPAPFIERWRPSIHMPRWASRITLEITGVRVERLQAISRGDAMAEGCPFPNMAQGDDPRQWFASLWEQINGPCSWDANPWVWVVEFKKQEPIHA